MSDAQQVEQAGDEVRPSSAATTQRLQEGGARRAATARTILEALAVQDYAGLAGALAHDVHLRALLPGGLHEWTGVESVARRFERWFGETEAYEWVDGAAGDVGGRLHLRWRVRLRAERLGERWFTVEQLSYADVDSAGRIARLDLLCTGYLPDGDV